MDDIFNYVVVIITVAVIALLIIAALLHHAVLQARQIASLERAWDMTGKYDFSMREAIQFIITYFENHEPAAQMQSRLGRACAKIREIGWAGKTEIKGHEFDQETETYQDFPKAIPAHFWDKNQIDPDFFTNSFADLPQTKLDEKKATMFEEQLIYGKLRINKEALRAMFSDEVH